MKVLERSENYDYQRYYHCFKAPIVSDRDILLEQFTVSDFPRKGDIALCSRSVADDACPKVKGKVRATVFENFQVLTPVIDEKTGEEHTEMFNCNQTDIAGSVPKWVIKKLGK